jgi:hypothetical protein
MHEKFNAEILTRSERDRTNDRIEISLCNIAGECRTISLGRDVISALSALLTETPAQSSDMTKIPDNFSVGHGRHEPIVMIRFEDEPAYGLTAEQAFGLGESLIEEAEMISTRVRYPARQ